MDELKKEMKRLGISQEALAERLGLDRSYVNQILNGKRIAPDWFEGRAALAVAVITKAEYEADKVRQKVLGR